MPKKFLLLFLLCRFTGTVMAQQEVAEANVKAAFIYNFTRYIDWDTTGNTDNYFVIGIIGSSAVTKPLIEIARTSRVNNKKILIQRYSKPEEIGDCQVLFIPKKIPYSLSSILDRTGKGVLTVSEEPGFAKHGTELNFVIVKEKVKFEANLKAIFLAGLKVSSQLLKLAIIVD